MEFTITITTGNDAMQTLGDITEALLNTAHQIDDYYGPDTEPYAGQGGWILDFNGNKVGRWGIEADRSIQIEDDNS